MINSKLWSFSVSAQMQILCVCVCVCECECKCVCVCVCVCVLFSGCVTANGSTPARDPIGAAAADLHHSHSNMGSKSNLQFTEQLTARPDP